MLRSASDMKHTTTVWETLPYTALTPGGIRAEWATSSHSFPVLSGNRNEATKIPRGVRYEWKGHNVKLMHCSTNTEWNLCSLTTEAADRRLQLRLNPHLYVLLHEQSLFDYLFFFSLSLSARCECSVSISKAYFWTLFMNAWLQVSSNSVCP